MEITVSLVTHTSEHAAIITPSQVQWPSRSLYLGLGEADRTNGLCVSQHRRMCVSPGLACSSSPAQPTSLSPSLDCLPVALQAPTCPGDNTAASCCDLNPGFVFPSWRPGTFLSLRPHTAPPQHTEAISAQAGSLGRIESQKLLSTGWQNGGWGEWLTPRGRGSHSCFLWLIASGSIKVQFC